MVEENPEEDQNQNPVEEPVAEEENSPAPPSEPKKKTQTEKNVAAHKKRKAKSVICDDIEKRYANNKNDPELPKLRDKAAKLYKEENQLRHGDAYSRWR